MVVQIEYLTFNLHVAYVQTYLERDVRDLVQVGDLNAFSRFLGLCAARTSLPLNMSELGRDAGVSAPTAHRWLSVLEASRIVHLLPPWHRNLGKRITKAPRLFFVDAGLAAFLQGFHARAALLQGPSLGALTETAVVAEWVKLFHQHGEEPSLFYWRASSGLEVDLLLERNGQLHALEIKATATPVPRHAENLQRWIELVGGDARGAVACRVDRPVALVPGIRAVPWHLAW